MRFAQRAGRIGIAHAFLSYAGGVRISGDRRQTMSEKRVLVVDDEPEICDVLREILEHMDLKVDTARSAEEAVLLFMEKSYDLLTLDIHMPGVNGVALHQSLSETFGFGSRVSSLLPQRLPPILVITGNPESSLMQELFLGERVMGVLKKPVTIQELQQVVADLLEWDESRLGSYDERLGSHAQNAERKEKVPCPGLSPARFHMPETDERALTSSAEDFADEEAIPLPVPPPKRASGVSGQASGRRSDARPVPSTRFE
jgi:CheY-like chemotaxis protein